MNNNIFQPKSRAQSWKRTSLLSIKQENSHDQSVLNYYTARRPWVPSSSQWHYWKLVLKITSSFILWDIKLLNKGLKVLNRGTKGFGNCLLMIYQYTLAWKPINYFSFTQLSCERQRQGQQGRCMWDAGTCGDIFNRIRKLNWATLTRNVKKK